MSPILKILSQKLKYETIFTRNTSIPTTLVWEDEEEEYYQLHAWWIEDLFTDKSNKSERSGEGRIWSLLPTSLSSQWKSHCNHRYCRVNFWQEIPCLLNILTLFDAASKHNLIAVFVITLLTAKSISFGLTDVVFYLRTSSQDCISPMLELIQSTLTICVLQCILTTAGKHNQTHNERATLSKRNLQVKFT